MRRTRLILVTTLVLSGLVAPLIAQAARPQPVHGLDELWFSIRITPTMVDWFNQVARPDDVVAANFREIALLDQVTAGRKVVFFASAAEAESAMPSLVGRVDVIGYDLEHWPATPADEQADPVATVQRLRELTQQYGLALALGPDRRFVRDYGVEMAPYVDQFALQVQRLQGNPNALLDFTQPLIKDLRQANPDLIINVQLRTEGSVDQLIALVDSLKEDIDGVSILYNPETEDVAKEFVGRLRSGEAGTAVAPTVAAPAVTPVEVTSTPTAEPLPTPTLLPTECTCPTGIVLTGSGLTALLLLHRRKRSGR